MYKYPSIEQFRNAIYQVRSRSQYVGRDVNDDPIYDETLPLPTLEYQGTVKLHGTNAAIVIDCSGDTPVYSYQSRSRVITPQDDNEGFAKFATYIYEEGYCVSSELYNQTLSIGLVPSYYSEANGLYVLEHHLYKDSIFKIYGEWCGQGIQSGTAISGLNKMFVIFSIQVDETWLGEDDIKRFSMPHLNVYTIFDFPTFDISIDFNRPETASNILADLTNKVEEQCPVGNQFGVIGIGEGIVWKCVTPGWEDSRFWFKVKGEKHQSSKVKTLAPVDVEKIGNIRELVSTFITESRLNQGMEGLTFDRKNLGNFIKWVNADVEKEESDTITANNFTMKDISSEVTKQAKVWFFEKEKESVGLQV